MKFAVSMVCEKRVYDIKIAPKKGSVCLHEIEFRRKTLKKRFFRLKKQILEFINDYQIIFPYNEKRILNHHPSKFYPKKVRVSSTSSSFIFNPCIFNNHLVELILP